MNFIIQTKRLMLLLWIYFKKQLFPYDYLDSFEKLKEGLPNKDKFYNTLTSRAISDKNYEHVLNIWKDEQYETLA